MFLVDWKSRAAAKGRENPGLAIAVVGERVQVHCGVRCPDCGYSWEDARELFPGVWE